MSKIAFICRRGPHGTASGREGLDALLATSALTESLALFLLGDGVLQLVKEQSPQAILQRHYAPTFKMLELYDIEEVGGAIWIPRLAVSQACRYPGRSIGGPTSGS